MAVAVARRSARFALTSSRCASSAAVAASVALSSGLQYGDAGAGHVRLNFGTSAELVVEIVHRMAAAA